MQILGGRQMSHRNRIGSLQSLGFEGKLPGFNFCLCHSIPANHREQQGRCEK